MFNSEWTRKKKRYMNSRTVTSPRTGMIYPANPAKSKPAPKPHGLVITDEDDKQEVSLAMSKLLNTGAIAGGGLVVDPASRQIQQARNDLVRFVAKQLLGNDWDCEVYT